MQSTTVARGDLLFLWHPDTPSIFSGFGLAVEAGRADLLIGLLIVDRPFPVSEAWLEEIEQTFGGFELYAMTATHDHGIACQMRVEADSLPYVRALDMPLAHLLRHALVPLLAQPPQPRFLMQWDPGQNLWTSKFDVSSAAAPTRKQPLFSLGQVVATPGALDALQSADQTPFEFLGRHAAGDWGDLCEEDRQENEHALQHGNRLFSAYKLSDGTKLWVITEWDRSVTTLLLPSEY
jgi:hypothetical protein